MRTRSKIIFINSVMALGAVAIIAMQWPDAMKSHSWGNEAYDASLSSRAFLAVILTGIPVVLYATMIYVLLSHVLFKPGELRAYKARQLLDTIEAEPHDAPPETKAKGRETATTIRHDD